MIYRLSAYNFRNLEPTDWRLNRGSHLLLGGTGAGKTALLEATYVALTTRSFRTQNLANCLRRGAEQESAFRLMAEVEQLARVQLEVGWSSSQGVWRQRNSERSRLAEHLVAQPVITWTQAETETWTGAPALRRRFLDRGLVGLRPHILEVLQQYRRVLAEKRAFLKRERPERSELDAWNSLLAEASLGVIEARRAYVESLEEVLLETAEELSPRFEDLALRYRPSPRGIQRVEDALEALQRTAERELAQRKPLAGPHLDAIELYWSGEEVGRVASAGERKTLGLLVLVAQRRLMEAAGRPPVLLVDDVDTELDRGLFREIWKLLSSGTQTLLSSNRPEAFEGLQVDRPYHLEKGRLLG